MVRSGYNSCSLASTHSATSVHGYLYDTDFDGYRDLHYVVPYVGLTL